MEIVNEIEAEIERCKRELALAEGTLEMFRNEWDSRSYRNAERTAFHYRGKIEELKEGLV